MEQNNIFPTPNESPLHAVHSHRSAEGSLKLNELMTLVKKYRQKSRLEQQENSLGCASEDMKKLKMIPPLSTGRKLSDAKVQEKAKH
ncbi:hypothetical protein Tco_0092773 [Tanacetum coccineum]